MKGYFDEILWGTIDELEKSLRKTIVEAEASDRVEIERRWLVKNGPEFLANLWRDHRQPGRANWNRFQWKKYFIAWLSTNPEIRVHRSFNMNDQRIGDFICLKENATDETGLIRPKFEFKTSPIIVDRVLNLIRDDTYAKPFNGALAVPVTLMIFRYRHEDGKDYTYEIRSADNGSRIWIDVEFDSREEADAFVMRPEYASYIDHEITGEPGYNMKAYWYQTRLHPYEEVN